MALNIRGRSETQGNRDSLVRWSPGTGQGCRGGHQGKTADVEATLGGSAACSGGLGTSLHPCSLPPFLTVCNQMYNAYKFGERFRIADVTHSHLKMCVALFQGWIFAKCRNVVELTSRQPHTCSSHARKPKAYVSGNQGVSLERDGTDESKSCALAYWS